MKNPFPKIGKIMKYEFKHSARALLPLYGVLLVLGLMTGLSVNQNKMNSFLDSMESSSSFEYHVEGADATKDMVSGLLVVVVVALSVAIVVLTIVTIARRFKQSMLGDEAYLNLSLPATMGEQLWGRFLTNLIFMVLCAAVIALTIIFCFIKMNIFEQLGRLAAEFNISAEDQNITFQKIIGLLSVIAFSASIWLISIIFVVNAISHLLKNNKSVVKFVSVIVLLWLNSKIFSLIPSIDTDTITSNAGYYFTRNSFLASAILIGVAAVYFAFTQYVFTKKLNLE